MIEAVVPTIPGREGFLADCVASLERHQVAPIVVEDSPSCGEGWEIGLQRCAGPCVLLCSDDFRLTVLDHVVLADHLWAGRVLSPIVWDPDGNLQGAGGMGCRMEEGEIAENCIAPLARLDVLEQLGPWPRLNHYCDTWITREARRLNIGPFVTEAFQLVHHHLAEWDPAEYDAWQAWQQEQAAA